MASRKAPSAARISHSRAGVALRCSSTLPAEPSRCFTTMPSSLPRRFSALGRLARRFICRATICRALARVCAPSVMVFWANSTPSGSPGAAAQDCAADVDGFARHRRGFSSVWCSTLPAAPARPKPSRKNWPDGGRGGARWKNNLAMQLGAADIIATVSHQHIYGLLFNILWPLAAGRAIHAQQFLVFRRSVSTLAIVMCAGIQSGASEALAGKSWLAEGGTAAARGFLIRRAVVVRRCPRDANGCWAACRSKFMAARKPAASPGANRKAKTNQAWTPLPGVDWRIDAEERSSRSSLGTFAERGLVSHRRPGAHRSGIGGFVLRRPRRSNRQNRGQAHLAERHRVNLTASPLVTSARVVALDGRRQRVAAFVVPSENGRRKLAASGPARLQSRAARSCSSNSIEPVGLPRIWRYLDALPVNAQGKTSLCRSHRIA